MVLPTLDLISVALLKIVKWVSIREEFHNLNVNDILFKWEACMTCGLSKGMKVFH